jgi:myo-inositol 2-dehydrogenase / D-chiro-inositol 1-dehydrogenase
MAEPLGVGLIGCGFVAELRHLPALEAAEQMRVVALADLDPVPLERVGRRFGVERLHQDPHSLIEDPAVEAVAVCVPAAHHADLTLAAIDAGKDVFVEKPLALTLEDCDRIIERAERSPRKVMVGFNLRWHRLVRRARDVIQAGKIGPVDSIQTVFTGSIRDVGGRGRTDPQPGGGVLMEKGVHHYDLWRYLLGSEVQEVSGISPSGRFEDDQVVVSAQMTNGALASTLLADYSIHRNELSVHGRDGRLELCCLAFDGLRVAPSSRIGRDVRSRLGGVATTIQELPRGLAALRVGGDYIASFHAEWRHFFDCVRHGAPVESTPESSRRVLEVALAAAESARRGEVVSVAEAPGALA